MSKIQNGFYHKSDNIWQEISGKHAGNTDTKNVTVILITRPQPSHYYRIHTHLPVISRAFSRVLSRGTPAVRTASDDRRGSQKTPRNRNSVNRRFFQYSRIRNMTWYFSRLMKKIIAYSIFILQYVSWKLVFIAEDNPYITYYSFFNQITNNASLAITVNADVGCFCFFSVKVSMHFRWNIYHIQSLPQWIAVILKKN